MTKVIEVETKPVHRRSTAVMLVIIGFASVGFIGGCEILAAVLHNAESKYQEAAVKKALADISALDSAVDTYVIEHGGRSPSSLREIALVRSPGEARIPIDPWGTPYQYEPLAPWPMRLRSFGSDGMDGGIGLAADLDLSDVERLRSQVSH